MAAPISPFVVAQVVARNIVPLAGIVFFHWSAANVLLLYFLDTLLAMAVIISAFGSMLVSTDDGMASRINGEIGAVAMGLFTALFLGVPLGVPIIFVLGPMGFHCRDALADGSLGGGALMQAAAAFWSYVELWKALRSRAPADLRLQRRFVLVFLRWMATLMVIYTGLATLGGPLLVVAAYVAVSIWSDVAPDHFLRNMPGGAGNDRTAPGAPSRPDAFAAIVERFRAQREQRKK